MRRLLFDRTGAGAAEFALVLPLLLLLLFGMIDTGRYMWEFNRAEKATQMGARFAVVTNPVASDLVTTNYVGSNGLTQGDLIPASALGVMTCTSVGCTYTGGTGPSVGTTRDATAFTNIVNRMKLMYPPILPANVLVSYSGSGLGYAGDPNGMEVAPLVTVKLTGVKFKALTSLMLANINMPDFATTLTAEDSSGTASN
jgi:Flp pilus assembly protein TadG